MTEDKKNILLIMSDQQALSTLKAYQPATPCITPNLDQLTGQGRVFLNNYTSCPQCSPARGTIMTGLYPHNHGITSNIHNLGCSVNEIPDKPEMLSRKLLSAGYQCGYTGKWHLGSERCEFFGTPNKPSLPRDLGFRGQNFPGHGGGGFAYQEYKDYLAEKNLTYKLNTNSELKIKKCGIIEGPVESTVPYFLAENTISLIDSFMESNSPFFIWHNFWGPHSPYFVPRKYYEMYSNKEIHPWPNYEWVPDGAGPYQVKTYRQEQLSWRDWEEVLRYYYGFMSLIDEQIGRIMEHLGKRGIREDTIIIFTSDHGETLGTHGGMIDKGYSHFEEIQHIPLIINLAGEEYQGAPVTEFTSLVDIYPTILELAGVEEPENLDGRSLLPLLKGETVDWRGSIVVEFNGLNHGMLSMRTIRRGSIKYGFSLGSRDELYDLKADPFETRNLIAEQSYQKLLKELRGELLNWMRETGDPLQKLFESTTVFKKTAAE